MGKWNRFKEVLGSLCDPYRGRLVGASEVAAREPRSPSSAILPSGAVLKKHMELCVTQEMYSPVRDGEDRHNHFQLAKSKKALEQRRGPDMRLNSLLCAELQTAIFK